jgi:hypothetical protein
MFSHRAYWFLATTDPSQLDPSILDRLQYSLHSIASKSIELVSRDPDNFFLFTGDEIQSLIRKLRCFDYTQLCTNDYTIILQELPESTQKLRKMVQLYDSLESKEEISAEIQGYKVDPLSIPLIPYPRDNFIDGFCSTLWFVEELTNISTRILRAPNRADMLKEQLKAVNSFLPAAVYIPFSNIKARSCAVLHIPVLESKVFATKERAPYMICIEIYNPLEELVKAQKGYDRLRHITRCKSTPAEFSSYKGRITRSLAFDNMFDHRRHQEFLTDSQYLEIIREATQKIKVSDEGIQLQPTSYYSTRSFSDIMPSNILNGHYAEDEENPYKDERSVSLFYGAPDIAGLKSSLTDFTYDFYNEEKPAPFKESFDEMKERIRSKSPFGKLQTWDLIQVIVKCGDDLRQEQLAMQLISLFKQIFKRYKLDLWLKDYEIIATGYDCGILECVKDAVSIDCLKKSLPEGKNSLLDFFKQQFGDKTRGNFYSEFRRATSRFVKSLAGYSLICYILQIKDRHNGNILIDKNGHIIHIDFGFLFSNSPGGNLNFEKAPFKLTSEFEEVMGGRRSKRFNKFRALCVRGYKALKKNTDKIILLVEMMRQGAGGNLPCFVGGDQVIYELKQRLKPREKMTDNECKEYVNWLINESLDNWTTRCYDRFQYCCQNIVY